MQYIKVRVLKNGVPMGGEYTYSADDSIKVDDIVNLPHFRPSESTNYPKGSVVGVGVEASKIVVPLENVKSIIGRFIEDTKEVFEKYLNSVKHLTVSEYDSKDAETRQDIDIYYVGYLNEESKKLKE